jgi:predicted AAA+ superfamily ATPase
MEANLFYRKLISELKNWAKQENRKPLILRGARQVGKTTVVDIFSKEFDQYLYLNLEKKEDAELFDKNLSIEDLTEAIFYMKGKPRLPGKTLLFVDEIQHSQNAIAMMRYFYESIKNIHVIAAGSLLEAMIGKEQISFPVGRVQYFFMYPLTFEEFLLAQKAEQVLEMYNTIPLPSFTYLKMLKLFHRYTLIGGMPEIVNKYCKTADIISLTPIYQGLISSYLDDVSKYARNTTARQIIRHAIETAPFEAGKRIKFQGFGNSNYRSREMGEALRAMERAMLISLIYPTTVTRPPLIPNLKKSPRLQFLDTGLLNFSVRLQDYFFTVENLHSFYQGILAEHIVGQELMALNMYSPDKLSFWVREKKQSNAEVDFIFPYKKYLIPIEVKSGKAGTLRSLHQFMDFADHSYAIRLYAGALMKTEAVTQKGKHYTLLNLPYFLAGKIQQYIEWLVEK